MTLKVGNKAPLRTFPPAPKPHEGGKGRRELLLEKAIAVKEQERRALEAEQAARVEAEAKALAEKQAARKAAIAAAVAPVVQAIKALDPRPYAKALASYTKKAVDAADAAVRTALLVSRKEIRRTSAAIAKIYLATIGTLVRTAKRLDPRPLLAQMIASLRKGLGWAAQAISKGVKAVSDAFISAFRAVNRIVLNTIRAIFRAVTAAAIWLSNQARAVAAKIDAAVVSVARGIKTFLKSVGEVCLALWALIRRADPRPLVQAAKHLTHDLIAWISSLIKRTYVVLAELVTVRRLAAVAYSIIVIGAIIFTGPRLMDGISASQQDNAEQLAEEETQAATSTRLAAHQPPQDIIQVPAPASTVAIVVEEEISPTPFEEHLEAPAVAPVEAMGEQRYASVTPAIRPEPDAAIEDDLLTPTPEPTVPGEARARIAIVIDDMGMVQGILPDLLALQGPITYAFLPYSPNLKEQTRRTREAGHQLMVHLPMEPKRRTADPGPNALLTALSPDDLATRIAWNLDRFDGYVGVNNHMGSLFTENSAGMRAVIAELKARNVFFLDSVTTSNTLGYSLAGEMGVARGQRDIFLDNKRSYSAVMKQLKKVERKALRDGQAIAIGHPYRVTHQALRDWLPTLEARGFEIVAASRLIEQPDGKENPIIKVAGKISLTPDAVPGTAPGAASTANIAGGTFE